MFHLSPTEKTVLKLSEALVNMSEISNSTFDNDTNFKKLHEALVYHKIFLLLYEKIIKYIPKQYQYLYDEAYYQTMGENMVLMKELVRLKQTCMKNRASFILIKGFAVGSIVFNDPYLRMQGDIDILVAPSDWEKTKSSLVELGYRMVKSHKILPKDIHDISYGFHECGYGKVLPNGDYLNIELHRNCGCIPNKYINDFINNTTDLVINNDTHKVFSPYYFFLHLCVNTYENFETYHGARNWTRLRDLVEICIYLKKYNIDLHKLKSLSDRYEMTHKLCCIFTYISKVLYGFFSVDDLSLFSTSSLSYIKDFYTNGAFLDFDDDLNFRLFGERRDKIKNFKILYKKRCHSFINRNYNHPYHISIKDSNQQSYTCAFNKNHYEWDIKYSVSADPNHLIFHFLINDETMHALKNKTQIIISFLNKTYSDEDLMLNIPIGNIQGKTGYLIDKKLFCKIDFDKKSNLYCFHIKIPLNILWFHKNEVCYNILLRDELHDNVFEWRGGKFECGEYNEGSLGVIKFNTAYI